MTSNVCKDCIGDPIVSAEIAKSGKRRKCLACGMDKRRTISLEALADRVDPVYLNLVTIAEEQVVIRGGHVTTEPVGESPAFLISELLGADDEIIGQALVPVLAGRHDWDVHEGGYDWYDESSDIYEIELPRGEDLTRGWDRFCDQLKHHRRFFDDTRADFFDRIFGPILRGEWPPKGAIRTVGPKTDITHVYRGRLANDESAQKKVYANRLTQLGPPPPSLAGAGRMNSAGISIFYGSLDADTCVAELRAPVGGTVIVGRFDIIRQLRVLDLTMLDKAYERLSYFAPDYAERIGYGSFMRGFHDQVRRVVIPGREMLDYLPTQIIAEYLWAEANPPIDGIIFSSGQISDVDAAGAKTEVHHNLVLFPQAALVEGATAEKERDVHLISYRGPSLDEDEDAVETEDTVYFNALPEAEKPAKVELPDDDEFFSALDDWFAGSEGSDKPAAPEPALRLPANGISRLEVQSIRYKNDSVPVSFEEWKALLGKF